MDRHKFETMFPSLVAHYPTVRSKDYYKAPERRSGPATAPTLLNGEEIKQALVQKEDFWEGLEVLLSNSLGPNDAARVRRAFVRVYQEHLSSLNLEQIEEVATSV
jgi:hypothetical protein